MPSASGGTAYTPVPPRDRQLRSQDRRAHKAQNFFVLRMDNLLVKRSSLSWRLPAIVLSSAVFLWKLIGEAECDSGIG